MIIESGSVDHYTYAAFLVIQEALADREPKPTNKHSKLTKAVINFLRKESTSNGHVNDKFWSWRDNQCLPSPF